MNSGVQYLEGGVDSWEKGADQRVAETVGGRGELVEDSGVAVGIVSFVESFRQQIEAVEVDGVPAEDSG